MLAISSAANFKSGAGRRQPTGKSNALFARHQSLLLVRKNFPQKALLKNLHVPWVTAKI